MKIAIIGAGLSGLVLAQKLSRQHTVSVFEKARGAGGRMSTRRADPYAFDHGAQYFTAASDQFQTFLAPLQGSGLVAPWTVDIAVTGGARISDKPKFLAVPGMNGLCKHLAQDIDLHTSFHTECLERANRQWTLVSKDGDRMGPFDWVISSAPSVQTAVLFPDAFVATEALAAVEMVGCFSLMLGFETPLNLPFQALKSGTQPIGWMAVNSAKPQRPDAFAILIQSDNAWAETHLEEDRDEVTAQLLKAASDHANTDLSVAAHKALHRWRYAAVSKSAETPFLMDPDMQLAACGDWCLGGKVEAAFLSASALAEQFVSRTGS